MPPEVLCPMLDCDSEAIQQGSALRILSSSQDLDPPEVLCLGNASFDYSACSLVVLNMSYLVETLV